MILKNGQRLLLILALVFSTTYTQRVLAQGQEKSVFDESLADFYVVAGTSIGGAILGLSTLSFVEEPGDHLKNVVVGGAIGMILGVGIVAYSQATKSRDTFYQENPGGASMAPPVSPLKHYSLFESKINPIWLSWKWQF